VSGRLLVVGTPIGNLGDLSPRAVEALSGSALICCEDTRHSAKLLSHAGIEGVRRAVSNEHTEAARVQQVLALLADGRDVSVITDAGMPGISDPGMVLVRAAIEAGHAVTVVPGPDAVTTALVLSGLDTTRFVFEGFLPRSGRERADRLTTVAHEHRTTVIYEAPHRIVRTVHDLEGACGGARRIALARELTKLHEHVWRGTLAEACAHVDAVEPRGEYVVVLEGAPPAAEATDERIVNLLRTAIAGGADRRTAIATVMQETGAAKRRVYDLALTIPRTPDE
jgi:16S rRNA (cytidine1402-2'-O)-methyltransferase